MDIGNRLFALALIPALSFFASDALAGKTVFDPAAKYAPSVQLADPIYNGELAPGVIKKCTAGSTLFRNVDPFISGGNPEFPVERSETFVVDGKEVVLTVTWDFDYSFSYRFGVLDADGNLTKAGQMHTLGLENSNEKFIYAYENAVQTDEGLNKLLAGGISEKANHIDICISPLDTIEPVVNIRLEPFFDETTSTFLGTVDGTTVSGLINILADVEDETEVNVSITIESEDGTDVTPVFLPPTTSECEPPDPDCTTYTWGPWDTNLVPPGLYTIIVTATETSGLVLDTIEPLIVTVSIQNCLEGSDGPGGTILGCNPTGYMFNELPNELKDTNLLQGQTLTQAAVPALVQDNVCGDLDGSDGGPYPFVGRDIRWGEVNPGEFNARPLDLSEVFDLEAVVPQELWPVEGLAVMRSDTRGEPCIALLFGDASFNFEYFYDPAFFPNLEGSLRYTYTLTQLPETPDLGLPNPNGIGKLSDSQPDLQKVPEATYQPTDRFIEPFIGNLLSPFTNLVINPNRVKIPDFSFYALGTVQICESLLGSGLSPSDGLPYYQAVLDCSTDLAVTYFDDLDELLEYVGAPTPSGYGACLIDPSAENLRVELNKARSMIKVQDWTKAYTRLSDLLLNAQQATWDVDERNCPGHVLMRIENLLWRTEQLEDAEGYLPLP
jgi:hypothetical protein